jgi:5-methylcytosine-specific restriction endonuclease McrA
MAVGGGACHPLKNDLFAGIKDNSFCLFRRDDYTCTTAAPVVAGWSDHVHPLSLGHSNEIGNLATACFGCNRCKMTKTEQKWMT